MLWPNHVCVRHVNVSSVCEVCIHVRGTGVMSVSSACVECEYL